MASDCHLRPIGARAQRRPPPNGSRLVPIRSCRNPACQMREPMKQKYLDDCAGLERPERRTARAHNRRRVRPASYTFLGRAADAQLTAAEYPLLRQRAQLNVIRVNQDR